MLSDSRIVLTGQDAKFRLLLGESDCKACRLLIVIAIDRYPKAFLSQLLHPLRVFLVLAVSIGLYFQKIAAPCRRNFENDDKGT